MIRDPALRKIVGADTFRAVAGPYLAFAFGRSFAIGFLPFLVVEPRPKDLHGPRAVLVLRFCSACVTTMPVGMCVMRTAESVVLTCWPPAPDARIVSMRISSLRTSMSMSLGFRKHGHRGRGSVDTAARFRFGYALDPVHTRFEFQPRKDAASGNGGNDFLVCRRLRLRWRS